MKQRIKQRIFPSVMAKDQQELRKFLNRLEGTAKKLHLDVADGKFVANKSLSFPLRLPKKFLYHAHLMIKNPEQWIIKQGRKVDLYIPQWEEVKNKDKYIQWMKSKKKKVAFALNPKTKVSGLISYLKEIDYILVLTVQPGFYGAKYLRGPLKKIAQIKKINPRIKVIVDGGMNSKTIKEATKAGADFFVSGSFVSKAEDPRAALKKLNSLISR